MLISSNLEYKNIVYLNTDFFSLHIYKSTFSIIKFLGCTLGGTFKIYYF